MEFPETMAVALLGEMYYRTGGGRRDFNIDPTGSTELEKAMEVMS